MNSQPQKLPQKLPIGIQSFSEMRKNGYRYVDKTPTIAQLVERGKYYFLSRPRRFGKSLLVDTLDCAFSARRELFKGLYLDSDEANWSWERKSPVLRIDFSGGTRYTLGFPNRAVREALSLYMNSHVESLYKTNETREVG